MSTANRKSILSLFSKYVSNKTGIVSLCMIYNSIIYQSIITISLMMTYISVHGTDDTVLLKVLVDVESPNVRY